MYLFKQGDSEQIDLSQRVRKGSAAALRVRPTADEELQQSFTRAALAWAVWRERQKWAGR